MREEAERRIGHLYPKVEVTPEMVRERPDLKAHEESKLTVIAWLWARTIASPNPATRGAHVPLASSFVLSSKKGREAIVVPVVERDGYRFTVKSGGLGSEALAKARAGTKTGRGANFICVLSGAPIPGAYIKAEGMAGRMGTRLMAVVAEGKRGRIYLGPAERMEKAAQAAEPTWRPNQNLSDDPRNIWCIPYGLSTFADLFTDRQLVAVTTFSDLVSEARETVLKDALAAGMDSDAPRFADGGTGAQAYADAVATYLGLGIGRAADYWSSNATWNSSGEKIRNTFARQAIPMVWDFAESNPFSSASGNWADTAIGWITKAVEALPHGCNSGTTSTQKNASEGAELLANTTVRHRPALLRQHRLCRPFRLFLRLATPFPRLHPPRSVQGLC